MWRAISTIIRCTPTSQALKVLAMQDRPDLRAAQEGVTAARSQESLKRANGKKDLGVSFDYTHTAGINSGAFFFNIDLPIFDRNQGEIAKARFAITQAEQKAIEAAQQVNTDIIDAYAALHSNDEIIQFYQRRLCRSGQAIAGYYRVCVQTRSGEPAGFSGCRANLSFESTRLSSSIGELHDGSGTDASSCGNKGPAMMSRRIRNRMSKATLAACDGGGFGALLAREPRRSRASASALGWLRLGLSGQDESKMTSYSTRRKQNGYGGFVYCAAGSDGPHASCDGGEIESAAGAAAHGGGGLQRVQDDAGVQRGRRPGAGDHRASRDKMCTRGKRC